MTDRASVEALAAAALAAYGRIDILAANAGIYPSTELAAIDDEIWERVMGINVKGALHALQACTPAMLARGYGRDRADVVDHRADHGPGRATPTTARPRRRCSA